MRRAQRARLRAGLGQPPAPAPSDDPRIHVSLAGLRALSAPARSLSFLPRQPARSVLAGRRASKLRGRGLDFEELRPYLPGDDPRAIDWKVTARTGEAHIRVMTEERDRPALIVLDQRQSMFFGTVHGMKSVVAAEAAALAAHSILAQGDRVGGIVFGDGSLAELRPERSRAGLERFLAAVSDANRALGAEAAPGVAPLPLVEVLRATARIAPRDHLILVFSDFDGISEEAARLVSGLSRRNDLILGLVSDPAAHELPDGLQIAISDGMLQAPVDTGSGPVRQRLQAVTRGRLAEVLDWERRFGVPVLPLSSGDETLPQMQRLMGRGR